MFKPVSETVLALPNHGLDPAKMPIEIDRTLALMEREIRENGITYNVYADPKGADRPWEVDPLPLLLSAAEWEEIEAGIAQRADLLNRVLQDVYGAQDLLRSLGLTTDSLVRVCKQGEPCIVQVRSTRIGLSKAVARRIFVIPEVPSTT